MTLSPQELDDVYTELCYRMSRAGDAATSDILARLCLLLMAEVGDAARIHRAVEAACAGFPQCVAIERPA